MHSPIIFPPSKGKFFGFILITDRQTWAWLEEISNEWNTCQCLYYSQPTPFREITGFPSNKMLPHPLNHWIPHLFLLVRSPKREPHVDKSFPLLHSKSAASWSKLGTSPIVIKELSPKLRRRLDTTSKHLSTHLSILICYWELSQLTRSLIIKKKRKKEGRSLM